MIVAYYVIKFDTYYEYRCIEVGIIIIRCIIPTNMFLTMEIIFPKLHQISIVY